MKTLIAVTGITLAGLAFPAFAHTESNDDIKAWVNHYFEEVDTEGNGYITREEFMDHADKKFDAMDTDHDGKLSKREVIAYKMQEKNDWRAFHHAYHTGGMNKPNVVRNDDNRPDVNETAKTNADNTSDR